MSSLPEIFRTTQSAFIRPVKQGGMYAVKYHQTKQQSATIVQPQQFYSVKLTKNTESRAATSHTMRSQKKASYADMRNIQSSESQRVWSRNVYSRGSSRQIRKDIFNNYGNSKTSFVIGQTIQFDFQQAQSLIHQLNENMELANKTQEQLTQIVQAKQQIKQDLQRVGYETLNEIKNIEKATQNQIGRLRQLLSDLRRDSGMQIKVNKSDAVDVEEGLVIIYTVMEQIDKISSDLQTNCIK